MDEISNGRGVLMNKIFLYCIKRHSSIVSPIHFLENIVPVSIYSAAT